MMNTTRMSSLCSTSFNRRDHNDNQKTRKQKKMKNPNHEEEKKNRELGFEGIENMLKREFCEDEEG